MPDNYSDDSRYLYLNTPLGRDKLVLLKFDGYEAMSEMFRFRLEVAAKKEDTIDFDQLVGKGVAFGVRATDDKDPRHFSGICTELCEGPRDLNFQYFTLTVVPKLWMLTQRRTCKIFQQKSVKDILTATLTGFETDQRLQSTYEPREFCVQYNETDFDFASRLMEEEGIGYYFKQDEGTHTMVLFDTPQGHEDCPGDSSTYTFDNQGGGNRFEDEERIGSWRRLQSWSPAKYTVWDHNFQLTDKHLDAEKTITPETITGGTVTHKLKVNGNDALELFEFPGGYAKRFDGISSSGGEQPAELNKIFQDNSRTVGIRMKQVATPALMFAGGGNCRRLTPGHKFTLSEHFDGDGVYVLTSVTHQATEGDFRSGADVSVEHYDNTFTAIPFALPFLPSRKTPRPRVFGCQTAKVVGPAGEEIFTDKYGRVKVQFRWDRDGQENSSSSCWLRVGTPWAGKNWGMIHIPRIGQEVIVDFMDGDPDKPIIVGSVYNPDQMPPYPLPDNKTMSGIKTRSSKGGGQANYNEIRFEDKMGSEVFTIHAEKDMVYEVEHDETHWVGKDQTITVDKDRMEIVKGDEKINVKGDRHNKIEGKHNEDVGGAHSLKVGGNQNVKVGSNTGLDAGQNVSIKAGINAVIEAGMGITLKGPGGFITIGPAGVAISGTLVLINSGGAALSGTPVQVEAPQVKPAISAIAPIQGSSASGSGPGAAVQRASIPSIPPLPTLPPPDTMANQVSAVMTGAVASAAQSVTGLASSLMQQVGAVTNQALDGAKQAGEQVEQVEKQVLGAVKDAEQQIVAAVDDAKKKVEGAIDEVLHEAQAVQQEVMKGVSDLENQAGQALQNVQQQMQQVANQAEQIAHEAIAEGKSALAQAAEEAQNAAHQAQQLANQAEQQVQQVAHQAEQMAQDAEKQGQQALNAAAQQVSALTKQAEDGVKQVEKQVQTAAQEAQNMAQQAMQDGEKAVSQVAQQAQQAAQQAEQQAKQAVSQAEQAAQQAAQQAEQQAQQAVKGVEDAADKAGKQVEAAAQDAQKQINNTVQRATKEAQQAGQMAEKSAQQVANQVQNSATQAANQIGQAAGQAFNQVGNTAGQAVKGLENSLAGLGL